MRLDQAGDISPADDEDAPEQDGGYQHDDDSRQHGQACACRHTQHTSVTAHTCTGQWPAYAELRADVPARPSQWQYECILPETAWLYWL